MKILNLKFKNLNSLEGEWQIDFTQPEYLANGIFAITGETGSGKTTILDAICLALYHQTPRLGKISSNSNEIFSKHAGDCYSEVTFQAKDGIYRVSFTQHKAGKKKGGKLQNYKHEISDAISGQVIETKNTENVVEEKSGMDFNRFTRSVLLAQGNFDQFLSAKPDERAPILEQITGTEIYSEISIMVHKRDSEEKSKLELLKAESNGIEILNEDEENELSEKLQEIKKNLGKNEKTYSENDRKIEWLNRIGEYETNIRELEGQLKIVTHKIEEFKPLKSKLQLAEKASEIEKFYIPIKVLREELTNIEQQLKQVSQEIPKIEIELKNNKKEYDQTHQKHIETKNKYLQEQPRIKRTRELDIKINELDTSILSQEQKVKQKQQQIAHLEKELMQKQEMQKKMCRETGSIQKYFTENKTVEVLKSEFSGIKQQLSNLEEIQIFIDSQEKKQQKSKQLLNQLNKKIQEHIKAIESKKKEKEANFQNLKNNQQVRLNLLDGRSLQDIRQEIKQLSEKKYSLEKIQSFDEERKKLIESQPCPLCGSKHHPYVKEHLNQNQMIGKQIEYLEKIEMDEQKMNESIKFLQENQNKLEQEILRLENNQSLDQKELDILNEDISQSLNELKIKKNKTKEIITGLEVLLKEYLPERIEIFQAGKVVQILEQKIKQWDKKKDELQKKEEKIKEFDSDIQKIENSIKLYEIEFKEQNNECIDVKNAKKELFEERLQIFAKRDPDQVEKDYNKRIDALSKENEKQKEELNHINQKLSLSYDRNQTLLHNKEKKDSDLINSEKVFSEKLALKGFENEQSFLINLIDEKEKKLLFEKDQQLETDKNKILVRLEDIRKKIQKERDKKVTEIKIDVLMDEQEQLKKSINEMKSGSGKLIQQIESNEERKLKRLEKGLEIDRQNLEVERWSRLKGLIGSSDGKKFRNFAQGITLEQMIRIANLQLQKLNDRYILIKEEKSLEINVIDNYQAGEIRPVKNLSGGESFIVSLALALGLSKMSSHRVTVDSLFLDEGFGTLDEETLETALETLACLKQDGKLIGVISHVPRLKERIPTQIKVNKINGGKSTLSGPGCQNVG